MGRVSNMKKIRSFVSFACNGSLDGNFGAEQDAFAYHFLVVRKLLSEVVKQEVHRRRPKTDLRIVQSDHSFRTNKSERPIRSLFQDQQVGASSHSVLYRPTSVRANHSVQYGPTFRTDQSDLSYGPTFRTDQSDPSYGPTFRIDQSDLSY